ncbi:hypothetical protein ASF38_16155 [Aeromicrobium sp. Leaf272]|nr:hypothetical protein ASF38_16155 [Aeromicrobium sp. Leaf272]
MRYENATQMWENVFQPACAKFGMTPIRADKISETGEIPEQIFTFLRDADVVIADLTGGNANVMYELGLRHTRDKITIQIGEHENLPFDVNTIRTVKFKRTEAGLIDARDSLIEALRTALSGEGKLVTATRVWNEMEALEPSVVEHATALSNTPDDPSDPDDDDGPGTVDLLAAGEVAAERMVELLEDFTGLMNGLGEVANLLGSEVENTTSFAGRLTLIRKYADSLKEPASQFDLTSAEYVERVNEVDVMVRLIISMALEDEDQTIEEDSWSYFRTLWGLRPVVEEASVGITGALQAAKDLRHLSNQLRPASKSLVHSFNTMLSGNQTVASWAEIIEEIPGSEDHLYLPDEEEEESSAGDGD